MLYGRDIVKFANNGKVLKRHFGGIASRDTLKSLHYENNKPFPRLYVCNTDKASQPGSHWFVVIVLRHGHVEIFDSFGLNPALYWSEIRSFVKQHGHIKYMRNKHRLQGLFATTCGMYCLYYMYHRVRDCDMACIMSHYTSNHSRNDRYVSAWYHRWAFDKSISPLS